MGFCHTLTWISHGSTCVPPILNPLPPSSPPHLLELSQNTGFGCPASWCQDFDAKYLGGWWSRGQRRNWFWSRWECGVLSLEMVSVGSRRQERKVSVSSDGSLWTWYQLWVPSCISQETSLSPDLKRNRTSRKSMMILLWKLKRNSQHPWLKESTLMRQKQE